MKIEPSGAASAQEPKAQTSAHEAWDAGDSEEFKAPEPLTPEEAARLRERNPPISPWRIVRAQIGMGVLMVLLWGLCASGSAPWRSALYGVVAVVVPTALMAWGTTRRPTRLAGAVLLSLMVWESIKIVLVIAILVAVVKWVPDLHWPALLLAMVGCLKVYWLVLLRQGRKKN